GHSSALHFEHQKTTIELCIVGHRKPSMKDFEDPICNIGETRRMRDFFVGDPMYASSLCRYWNARVDEEVFSKHHSATVETHESYFEHSIFFWIESGRLKIDHDPGNLCPSDRMSKLLREALEGDNSLRDTVRNARVMPSGWKAPTTKSF